MHLPRQAKRAGKRPESNQPTPARRPAAEAVTRRSRQGTLGEGLEPPEQESNLPFNLTGVLGCLLVQNAWEQLYKCLLRLGWRDDTLNTKFDDQVSRLDSVMQRFHVCGSFASRVRPGSRGV